MIRPTLHAADHERIAAAIRAAEETTSGEIYCVVARASDSYFFPSALILCGAMLVAGLAVAFALEAYWIVLPASTFLVAQASALLAALALLWLVPAIRLLFVPRRLRYLRAHDNALKQFLARNVHITAARTGVLIFVSLAERYAEVVADGGVDAKVPQSAWNDIVGDLVEQARRGHLADGFVAAVAAVGPLLAEHFPRRGDDRNELDDHLVEI